jgi:hypothetical protein
MKEIDGRTVDSLLKEYKESGLSLKDFASRAGVDYQKLCYQNRKRREQKQFAVNSDSSPAFINLDSLPREKNQAIKSPSSRVVIVFSSGLRLEING